VQIRYAYFSEEELIIKWKGGKNPFYLFYIFAGRVALKCKCTSREGRFCIPAQLRPARRNARCNRFEHESGFYKHTAQVHIFVLLCDGHTRARTPRARMYIIHVMYQKKNLQGYIFFVTFSNTFMWW